MAEADRPGPEDDRSDPAERARLAAEAELEAGRMPFVEHLRELRLRIRNSLLALIVGVGIAYALRERIFGVLARPLADVWRELALTNTAVGQPRFQFFSLLEPFWTFLSIALWGGVFLAAPVIFHQLWLFIAPGLYRTERRYGVLFALSASVLFAGGAVFCYTLVLPNAFPFFLGYSTADLAGRGAEQAIALAPLLGMDAYLSFVKTLLIAFGLVFQLPLVITFLALAGLVTHTKLWRFNRWFVIVAFVVSAVLTPGPDVISQVAMALPLIALYNASIVIAWLITRRRARAAIATS